MRVESFRDQLHLLRVNNWETVIPDRLGTETGKRRIIITFDDGHKSDLIAAEMMEGCGYRGVFYVPVEHLDRESFLSRNDVKGLSAQGFLIGSHGLTHQPLTNHSEPKLWEELYRSRLSLEDLIGSTVRDLALPFGRYTERILAMAKAAGYERIMTSDIGLVRPSLSVAFPRLPVTARTTDKDFERLLYMGSIGAAVRRYSTAFKRRWWHQADAVES